jgi:hypothetical protein
MSTELRILLLMGSVFMLWYVVNSIRKSKVQMKDAVIWVLIAILIVVFAVWPQFVVWLASLMGIESATNMVFLLFIVIVLLRIFSLSIRVSLLEDKNSTLAAEIALRSEMVEEETEQERKEETAKREV